jgi:hypothetical protein
MLPGLPGMLGTYNGVYVRYVRGGATGDGQSSEHDLWCIPEAELLKNLGFVFKWSCSYSPMYCVRGTLWENLANIASHGGGILQLSEVQSCVWRPRICGQISTWAFGMTRPVRVPVPRGHDVKIPNTTEGPGSGGTLPYVVRKRKRQSLVRGRKRKHPLVEPFKMESWTYVLRVLLTVSVTVLNLHTYQHAL